MVVMMLTHLQLLYFVVRIMYLNDSLTGWHWVCMNDAVSS